MYHTAQTQNFIFDLFDLVTLDDLNLTQGHEMPRRVLRSIPDTMYAILSALFHFHTAALPGEASNDRYSKLTFDPICYVISDVQIKLCSI